MLKMVYGLKSKGTIRVVISARFIASIPDGVRVHECTLYW